MSITGKSRYRRQRRTLKAAQTEGGTNPTAEQKQKIDDAAASLQRAQTNLEAAQLKYVNEYVPETFTYTRH